MISCLTDHNSNVYRKTKALDKFKNEESEVKVILLSLSVAASSKEEAQAYETQAIGRAQRQGQTKPVTVVRFIIKNTIEHDLCLRNTSHE